MANPAPAAQRPERPKLTGVERIAAERQRQIDVEGWTPEHDDEHDNAEMAMAAACYAAPDLIYTMDPDHVQQVVFEDPWPWDQSWDKRPYRGNRLKANATATRATRIRMLEKAGALIAAEIDRILREQDLERR